VSNALLDAICDRFHATQQRAADFQRRSADQAATTTTGHGAGAGASDSSDADGFVMVDSAGAGVGAGAGAGGAAPQPSVSHADVAAAKAALEPMSTDGIADTIRQWYEDDELAAYPELVDAIVRHAHALCACPRRPHTASVATHTGGHRPQDRGGAAQGGQGGGDAGCAAGRCARR